MPLREISINVPRDGSPQQQSLRKKATVEALATSLFSPRGRGSIVDAVSALIEARGGEESPTSSGRVTPADASKAASASPAKSLGSPFASTKLAPQPGCMSALSRSANPTCCQMRSTSSSVEMARARA